MTAPVQRRFDVARATRALLVCSLVLTMVTTTAPAATNQATGDVAGDTNALQDSNVLTLNSTGSQLALVKRAFLPDGTPVPDASTLPEGSVVKFAVYINNTASVEIRDVSIQDILDPAFVYTTGSIRVDNTIGECAAQICTPGEEAVAFAAVDDNTPLTDGVNGDVAAYAAGPRRIDLGNDTVANGQLNIAPDSVWIALFEVTLP